MTDQVSQAPSSFTRGEIEARIATVPFWWHSIDVGQGITTRGHKTPTHLAAELKSLRLPDLCKKTVLDIGAWDGFYSFAAERLGAERVTALDHFVWSTDLKEHKKYYDDCIARGVSPEPYETMPYYKPLELPGKRGFDIARELRGSKVESIVADFMNTDLKAIGTFDVVLFLGVLYHMKYPIESLERLAALTREVAIIETEAVFLPGLEEHAFCEYFEKGELNHDISNWWAPNQKALVGMCRTAGFRNVTVTPTAPTLPAWTQLPLHFGVVGKKRLLRYRAVVQAWK
jgi:tRNA (mo5U34)-methyltransferase